MDLEPFIREIKSKGLKLEGITVSRKAGKIAGYRWIPESKRNVYSVSKSFVSVAVGMAIDEGKLELSGRVIDFFPQKDPSPRLASLTLEHLLTMNMGHPGFSRPRNVEEALSCELKNDPGTCFCYDNTCTFLASAMLTKATGLKLRDFLLDRLFRPLGIPDPQWEESEDGYTIGASGLMLTTSEMALFGRFLLRHGNWEGRQLVSESWIERATRTQAPTRPEQVKPDWDLGYGYQFWTCRHGAYRSEGKEGQFIIVFPGLDAAAAINACDKPIPILCAVWDYLMPLLG